MNPYWCYGVLNSADQADDTRQDELKMDKLTKERILWVIQPNLAYQETDPEPFSIGGPKWILIPRVDKIRISLWLANVEIGDVKINDGQDEIDEPKNDENESENHPNTAASVRSADFGIVILVVIVQHFHKKLTTLSRRFFGTNETWDEKLSPSNVLFDFTGRLVISSLVLAVSFCLIQSVSDFGLLLFLFGRGGHDIQPSCQ